MSTRELRAPALRNRGFTLIEAIMVVAMIVVIVVVAFPHLRDKRVTSQESAAAASLKSGILPAEVQFQAGGYADGDGNRIGAYCVMGASGVDPVSAYATLSGSVAIGGAKLEFLAPPLTGASPVIRGYVYKQPITATTPSGADDGSAERTWGVITYPENDQQGRRFFCINQAGNVYSSLPSAAASSGPVNRGGAKTTVFDMFGPTLASGINMTYRTSDGGRK